MAPSLLIKKTMPSLRRQIGSGSRSRKKFPEVSRYIGWPTKLLLVAHSGGQCQFASCKRNLFEHPLTLTQGNFAEFAHIIAFSRAGPRGGARSGKKGIHNVTNLMLLCHDCHKLIDDNPDMYSPSLLREYKAEQERRVQHLLSLAPDMRTAILQFKARIHGQAVDIPVENITTAVQPRFPISKTGVVINLNNLEEEGKSYYEIARRKIRKEVKRLYEEGSEAHTTRHISLFALGPIPLLVALGNELSSAFAVDLFQRQRENETWTWKTDGRPVEFVLKRIRLGRRSNRVALMVSLSGKVEAKQLPTSINKTFTIYEILPQARTPNVMLLKRRQDLENFRRVYQEFLGVVTRDHSEVKEFNLFPAIPAPIAVLCGRELLRKKHPRLKIWDLFKKTQTYRHQITVN